MLSMMNVVDEGEWDLSGMHDRERALRLSHYIPPEDIIDQVVRDATDDKLSLGATWMWEAGELMIGCGRAIMVIPLTTDTFDNLFNGRCGYRAQYYLSASDGEHFNERLVDALRDATKQIFKRDPKSPGWPVVEHSIKGPQSKISVHGEQQAYTEAPKGEFRPHKWAHRAHTVWLRAPLPQHSAIELKGSWLDDYDRSYRLDPLKSDRHQIYHEYGNA